MSAGLPGTGIGGLFYLLGALWMPVQEGWSVLSRRPGPRRWRAALLQSGMALAILAGIWATGWLLALVLLPSSLGTSGSGSAAGMETGALPGGNVLRAVVVFGALGVLAAILATVQVLRLVVRRPPPVRPERPEGEPVREAA